MRHRSLWLVSVLGLLISCFPAMGQSWRTYSEIGQILADAEADYPNICRLYEIGTSVQGRKLWALRISDNIGEDENEPEFKYISTMHGNEWTGTEMCLYLIDDMLTNYNSDPEVTNLVNNIDIWIMPLMNPDGFSKSTPTRENANYVDLNRHFPEGTYDDPNDPSQYEPEVAAIMTWGLNNSFVQSANFHGGAEVVNYPYDKDYGIPSGSFAPSPDEDLFVYISEAYSRLNSYMWNSSEFDHGITNGSDWYSIDGGMQDWNYRYMSCNECCIELSNNKIPSASQIPYYWDNNEESMKAFMAQCLIGVRGLVTDAQTGDPLAATVTVEGNTHPVYTDPDVGDYHRMLLPGTYTLTFSADGYADDVVVEDVAVISGAATVLNIQMGTAIFVTYPNGGEELPVNQPVDVTWTSLPTFRYNAEVTSNYGDTATIMDGFERSTLGDDYQTGGDVNWWCSVSSTHTGWLAARAGNISHNQTTWMTRTVQQGDLSFWYKVDSEEGYDYFRFYIDGAEKFRASGFQDWTEYSTTLPEGSHELKWEYSKDNSSSFGADTAWVDDLSVTVDNTEWTTLIAQSSPGVGSVSWTPTEISESCKVRVRTYLGGGNYGAWVESDDLFSVVASSPDGDFDEDGDVDLADFAGFQSCFNGSTDGACSVFDFDGDLSISLTDFAAFEALLTGPVTE